MTNKKYNNLILARKLLKTELENKGGVYKLINDKNGKSYVGSSNNIYRRLGEHCNINVNIKKLLKGHSAIGAALLKYGPDNFSLIILEVINLNNENSTQEIKKSIISKEQHYINLIKPEYNLNPIAGSNLGRIYSAEVRAKMSEAKKGLPSHWKGKKRSLESVALLVNNHGMKKMVHQYNPDGTYFKSYPNILMAEASTGIPRKRIQKYAKQTPAVLLKENIILSFNKSTNLTNINTLITDHHNRKKLYVYNADGSLFKIFDSIAEGVKNTNVSYKKIVKYANLNPSVVVDGKYIFSFENIHK